MLGFKKRQMEISDINPRPGSGGDDTGFEDKKNKREKQCQSIESHGKHLIFGECINMTANRSCLGVMPGRGVLQQLQTRCKKAVGLATWQAVRMMVPEED